MKEKFENKKSNTSDSKHNIPTYIHRQPDNNGHDMVIVRLVEVIAMHKNTKKLAETKQRIILEGTRFDSYTIGVKLQL